MGDKKKEKCLIDGCNNMPRWYLPKSKRFLCAEHSKNYDCIKLKEIYGEDVVWYGEI